MDKIKLDSVTPNSHTNNYHLTLLLFSALGISFCSLFWDYTTQLFCFKPPQKTSQDPVCYEVIAKKQENNQTMERAFVIKHLSKSSIIAPHLNVYVRSCF